MSAHIRIWKADNLRGASFELESQSSFSTHFILTLLKSYIRHLFRSIMLDVFIPAACSSSPCLHDGTCILDSSRTYRCACLGGYTGKNCEHGEFQTTGGGTRLIIRYLRWVFFFFSLFEASFSRQLHRGSLCDSLRESFCSDTKNIESQQAPPSLDYCAIDASQKGLDSQSRG